MADQALIDQYLGELAREVRWIRDAEDIIEEVADHLLEAVAVLEGNAQREIRYNERRCADMRYPVLERLVVVGL